MKKTSFLPIILMLSLTLFSFQCDEDNSLTQEEEQAKLSELKIEIETLAESSVCNESTECKFIAFGDKPCGGPWSYLIYSTSIDTEKLENLVAAYNVMERKFNEKYSIVSTCEAIMPPTSLDCENNTCVAVY